MTGETTAIMVGPAKVHLRTKDDGCCRHVRQEGSFEPETLAAWARLCAGGGLVLDVGAYTGLFSIAARKMGCSVVAFEPLPENAQRVRHNAFLNQVDVELLVAAVADGPGNRNLWYSTVKNTSAASLVQRRSRRIRVPSVRLDDLSLGRVRVIKIDVEHAEHLVLRGASRLLQEQHPALLVEVLGSPEGEAVSRALALREGRRAGYRLRGVLDGRNWLVEYLDA